MVLNRENRAQGGKRNLADESPSSSSSSSSSLADPAEGMSGLGYSDYSLRVSETNVSDCRCFHQPRGVSCFHGALLRLVLVLVLLSLTLQSLADCGDWSCRETIKLTESPTSIRTAQTLEPPDRCLLSTGFLRSQGL